MPPTSTAARPYTPQSAGRATLFEVAQLALDLAGSLIERFPHGVAIGVGDGLWGARQGEIDGSPDPGFVLGVGRRAIHAKMLSSGKWVPPTSRPWSRRTASVRDRDGYLIELAQDRGA